MRTSIMKNNLLYLKGYRDKRMGEGSGFWHVNYTGTQSSLRRFIIRWVTLGTYLDPAFSKLFNQKFNLQKEFHNWVFIVHQISSLSYHFLSLLLSILIIYSSPIISSFDIFFIFWQYFYFFYTFFTSQ